MKLCNVCGGKHHVRGMCSKHYFAALHAGEIQVIQPKGLSLEARLSLRSKVNTETGCIEWLGARSSDGYGNIVVKKKTLRTHRVAWEVANGAIPADMQVLHRCDNPPCINPDHLFLGTQIDNIADMVAKARQAKGEEKKCSKLTEVQVRLIRRDSRTYKAIASDLGLSQEVIGQVKRRATWRHVA